MEDFIGVKNETSDILGKFLYFSLSNVLIERQKLQEICESMNLPISLGNRVSAVDAFKSATGDIYERIVTKNTDGVRISKVYCRDNKKVGNIYSREFVKETLGESTNRYKKLANIYYDTENDIFDYALESHDDEVDVYEHISKARDLFSLYKTCVSRSQVETLADNFLAQMEALKISVHGRLFFIPKKSMGMLDIFEDFIEEINANNSHDGKLIINSMFVANDEKQRSKMTVEFYNQARQEIEQYTQRIENLISNGSQSPAVLERWVAKISGLEAKKRNYEELLKNELSALDDEYGTLKFLTDELSVRANRLRLAKCA